MIAVYIVAILFLIACSAFFSGSETAVFAYDRLEARELARRGKGALAHIYRNLHIFLPTAVSLNLFVNMGISVLTAVMTVEHFGAAYLPLVGAISTALIIAFSELTPKIVAVRHTKSIAEFASVPFVALMAVVYPVIAIMVWGCKAVQRRIPWKSVPLVTAAEVRFAVDEALERKAIGENEARVLSSIMAFRERHLREFMTPRPDIVFLPIATPLPEVRHFARVARFARLPVTRGKDIDSVVGCVHVKEVLMRDEEPARSLRPVYFAPECMTAGSLFQIMRARAISLAMVVDEYGQVVGLVSIHDLLEELLGGEYPDEYTPEAPWVTRKVADGWVVNAAAPIEAVNKTLGLELPEDRGRTLAGFLFQALGHLPERGESVRWGGWEFVVQVVRRKRIAVVGLRKESA